MLDSKLPEEVYKSHLEPSRLTLGLTHLNDSRNNLKSDYFSWLVNCGFGRDKLIIMGGEKIKKIGKMSMITKLVALGLRWWTNLYW